MNTSMLADIFGPDLVVVALIAVVVLFGGSQLPKLARSLGSASHEFRKGIEEGSGKDPATPDATGTASNPAKGSDASDATSQS